MLEIDHRPMKELEQNTRVWLSHRPGLFERPSELEGKERLDGAAGEAFGMLAPSFCKLIALALTVARRERIGARFSLLSSSSGGRAPISSRPGLTHGEGPVSVATCGDRPFSLVCRMVTGPGSTLLGLARKGSTGVLTPPTQAARFCATDRLAPFSLR